MSDDPSQRWSVQRPPLNPLHRLSPGVNTNNMKVSEPPPAARQTTATTTTQPPISKRHSPENTTDIVENENAPLALHHKRQRTKSGSEPLEGLSPCQDGVIAPESCGKADATPLCERNVRTSRLEGGTDSLNATSNISVGSVEPSCSSSSSSDNLTNSDSTDGSRNDSSRECRTSHVSGSAVLDNVSDGILVGEYLHHRTLHEDAANGNLSPHCAATLEYVTQLPEGCGVNPAVLENPNLNGALDPEEDLEDDDNYLDSSEEEEEEDLLITTNDDDESCGEDDQSVISSVTVGSTCSLRSVASEALNTVCINEHGVAANEDGSLLYGESPSQSPLPSLTPSQFWHVPPSINFCQYNESTVELPLAIGRLLKWRFTNVTPLIVKKTISNSGFKITKKTMQWTGTWGKHMKSPCFKAVREYQKINHFPGTFQIGRKDKLWKNFVRLQSKFGKEEFGFIPKTFVLPGDLKMLKAAFDKEGVKKKWIIKPPASARGTGIQVIDKWSQVQTESPVVVQRYISRPYLINDTKFDMRLYVLVTSFHPLRIYLYQDGLVRFASVQYKSTSTSLSDRFMHLTNYSVNKSSSSYTHNTDAGQCQGHKWTLKSLWGYLKAKGVDSSDLWSRIVDLVIKTVISGEKDMVVRSRKNVRSRYSCYELFGIDVIIDEKLRPWLLEVNISPSLHSASPLDHSVKGPLIANVLNMASFHIPDKLSQQTQKNLLKDLNLGEGVSSLCLDRRLHTRLLRPEDQVKHIQINGQSRSQYLSSAIENLNSDDIRYLLTAEDELHRAGKFTKIFPTAETHQYFGFMERPRYYNRLMDAWENAYGTCREKGLERLQALCKEKIHLQVPATFKMPKVKGSGSFRVTSRQPFCPQLVKGNPAAQIHLLPSQTQPSQVTSSLQSSLPPQSQPQLLKRSQRTMAPRKWHRRAKLKADPRKRVMVTSYLLARHLAGRSSDNEEGEEVVEMISEGTDDGEVDSEEGQGTDQEEIDSESMEVEKTVKDEGPSEEMEVAMVEEPKGSSEGNSDSKEVKEEVEQIQQLTISDR